MIDLHCHSNFSDGAFSPDLLLAKALQAGLKVLALTDHDTMAGLPPLHEAARNQPIQIINGIEFSTRWRKYDIHIIGLNITDIQSLQSLITCQNKNRIDRALQIAERMKQYGVDEAYAKACEIAGHERVGRPHFAQVCVAENLVPDTRTAFKRFLAKGRPAYVPTPWISVTEAVAGIVQAGGQAVLAHPLKYLLTRTKLHELIAEFKAAGGVGLEVVSGETTVEQTQDMAGLCLRFQLLASTGSDYHGGVLSRIFLGGQRQLPVNCTPIWDQWL